MLYQPTSSTLLSVGSPTKDEDPSVIRARDGRMFIAWFSDRGKNPDIYITCTSDGKKWHFPVRVTTDKGGDFCPSLYQDPQGVFHLAWFRWTKPFLGNIYYNSSPDGLTWDPSREQQVTHALKVDDWVPTLTQAPDGTLLIYFVSHKRDSQAAGSQIYIAFKRPEAPQWNPVIPAAALRSPDENNHLPFAAYTGKAISLVWVRYDTKQPLPWLTKKSDIYCASSTDGIAWGPPVKVIGDAGNIVNTFPTLHAAHDSNWRLTWVSTRRKPSTVLEAPFDTENLEASATPTELSAIREGYSHHFAATPTPGVYLAAWVQGKEGKQDVYYRFLAK